MSLNNPPFTGRPPNDFEIAQFVKSSPVPLLSSAQLLRPLSVAAIGDSITDLNWAASPFLLDSQTAAQTYANSVKAYSNRSWLLFGAMRSGLAWFPFEYGATTTSGSAAILAKCVPALIGNPYGLPDACVVLAGTHDRPGDINLTIPQLAANLKTIYNTLSGAGITPIAATLTPNSTTDVAWFEQAAHMIMQLARELGIPCVDFYSALVDPSTGKLLITTPTLSVDGTHPSAVASGMMGYVLNQTILGWTRATKRLMPAAFDTTSITAQSRDPNFLSVTGTVNTSSSYPTMWGAPTTLAMATVFSSSGTEPGSGHTMARATPNILGFTSTPLYLGNSYSLKGDGTHQIQQAGLALTTGVVGHKYSLYTRLKVVVDYTKDNSANIFTPRIMVYDNGSGHQLFGMASGDGLTACQVGSETGYDAGDLYLEYTVPAGSTDVNFEAFFQCGNASGASNTGDSITIANFLVRDLTAAGIVSP